MKILVLPGDGIGPEITQATLTVLNRANDKFKLGLEWDQRDMGLVTLKSKGSTLPDDVMEAARKAPGIILGPVDHLIYPTREKGGINPSGEFRTKLDLFANIRPAISLIGSSSGNRRFTSMVSYAMHVVPDLSNASVNSLFAARCK